VKPSVSQCTIRLQIKGNDKILELAPQQVTLNGEAVQEGKLMSAGEYVLKIAYPGFEPFQKKIVISEGTETYTIQEVLIAPKFAIMFQIMSESGGEIQADKILIDGKDFSGEVTPGMHEIEIHKKGYKTIKEPQEFKDSEPFCVFLMKALPRAIRMSFKEKGTDKAITPLDVLINNRRIALDQPIQEKPGDLTIDVMADGYEEVREKVSMLPDDQVFEITIEMTAKPK